jgi:hypothetical protein
MFQLRLTRLEHWLLSTNRLPGALLEALNDFSYSVIQ